MATDIVTRSGKGAALSASNHDQNMNGLAGVTQEQTGATYTVLYTDQNQIIELNNASMVCTLPAIATVHGQIDTDNFQVTLVNTNATEATVSRSSTDTFIGGATSIKLKQYEYVVLQSDSTGAIWHKKNVFNELYKQYSTTVTGSAAALMEVTGLDTNYLNGYRIEVFVIGAGVSSMYIEINQDTTITNYNGRSVTNGATATTSNTPYLGATFSAINTVSVIDVIPNATAGSITCVFQSGDVTNLHVTGLVEYAITDNITSLGISTNSGSHLGVGSYIRVHRNLDT